MDKMDKIRHNLLEIYNKSNTSGNPLSWFEEIYNQADSNREWIPWDWKEPHPFVVEWIEKSENKGNALVIGCGLGEDAAYLSKNGWNVTAFDISETAIKWASEIHKDPGIDWKVADLFYLPDSWKMRYDLVLEVHILQAIQEDLMIEAREKLAPLVSINGHLVCIGKLRINDEIVEGPPWPMSKESIEETGKELDIVEFHVSHIPEKEDIRYRATWKRAI